MTAKSNPVLPSPPMEPEEFSCPEGCDFETGECGVCEGERECTCHCHHCGSDADHDCGHCDGTGICEDWAAWKGRNPTAVEFFRKKREKAEVDWREFMEEQSFKPSVANFTAAWRKMFGVDPSTEALTQWRDKVTNLAKAADVHVEGL